MNYYMLLIDIWSNHDSLARLSIHEAKLENKCMNVLDHVVKELLRDSFSKRKVNKIQVEERNDEGTRQNWSFPFLYIHYTSIRSILDRKKWIKNKSEDDDHIHCMRSSVVLENALITFLRVLFLGIRHINCPRLITLTHSTFVNPPI